MALPVGYERPSAWDEWYDDEFPGGHDDMLEEITTERYLADTLMSALDEAWRDILEGEMLSVTIVDLARQAWADARGVDLGSAEWDNG